MSDSMKTVVLVASFGTACALALAWWFQANRAAIDSNAGMAMSATAAMDDVEDAAALADQQAKASALRLIAAESRQEPPPSIEAPPNFQPATIDTAQAGGSLPAGFSVTAFHGAMAKGRMTEMDYDRDFAEPRHTLTGTDGVDTLAQLAHSAGRDWTFGWIGTTPRADLSTLTERLRGLDADVLGRAGDLLRARLPGDVEKLRRIDSLEGVAQLAAMPADSKAAPAFLARVATQPLDRTPAFVTLMTGDPDGRWRGELRRLGATVGRFDPAVRVYAATVPHGVLADILAADFVQAVEPMGRVTTSHAAIVPAMGADALRLYDEVSGLFSGNGGSDVAIGVMDTGLNINHVDIVSNRRSICGGNFVPAVVTPGRTEDQDLWIDSVGHGTHVTGTIAGNGSANASLAGMAPLVQDIRFAKVLGSLNGATDAAIGRGMDFLARASSCGSQPVAAKPLLVNMSLGLSDADWEGRSTAERKLDATVWSHRQLYVVAAGNDARLSRGDFASAKNSLTVGATETNGDIARFSSHGPTFDGRLKPQVVGTGVGVASAAGNGARRAYALASGTSMSSPAVAGVAALLMNAAPSFREQPALTRARFMASAIKPDAFLEDVRMFPLHNGDGPGRLQNIYGLGKVSAHTSILNRDQEDGWRSGAATVEIGDGEYGYHDIEVPAGASRLDVAMTWDEPPADTFAQTLLNDLDLWIDRDADCPDSQPATCGDAASRSTIDNVEWLILRDPPAGTYRIKIVPKRARVQTPRAALAWTIVRGPSTPQLAIEADKDAVAAQPNGAFEVEVALTVDGYVAAGTVLRIDCRAEAGSRACEQIEYIADRASSASREDNVRRSLANESSDRIALGELVVGERQTVRLVFAGWPETGRFHLYFTASAWNAGSASTHVDVAIGDADGAPPALATVPANDDFATALPLRRDSGQVDFDLLLATPEPGEPPFSRGLIDDENRVFGVPQAAVRPRSIWYAWTAPASDTYRVSFAPSPFADFADNVQLDLFEATKAAALASLASTSAKIGGGLAFAARRGQTYGIRLSVTDRTLLPREMLAGPFTLGPPLRRRVVAPLTLNWQRAARPSNDDFDLATAIGGANGTIEASNFGATSQRNEFFYPLAGTTWYRWQAPASGDWHFAVERSHLRLAAFVGSGIDDLRLVSGEPSQEIVFPAREGAHYHLLVAAANADASGSEFTLRWSPGQRADGNDDMANATELPALPSFFYSDSQDFATNTVEPGEPAESGSRTGWWSWTAPMDGDYTWRVSTEGPPVRLSMFAADADAEPAIAAMSRSETQTEVVVSVAAVAGQRYLIAAGLASDAAFTPIGNRDISFRWGPAPENDHLAAAIALVGRDGSVTGSNRYATVESGEGAGALGDSSLWWSWQADEDGWQRFALADAGGGQLAIYEMAGMGFAQLELVATSRRLAASTDAIFEAKAGTRYAIRLAAGPTAYGGPFMLQWQADEPPAWLRFVGGVLDGGIDADGKPLAVADPQALAFDADGGELYAVTADGLQVYGRDAATGALGLRQQINGDNSTLLLWDARTASLIAGSCDGWRRFASSDSGLRDAGLLQGDIGCPEPIAFADDSGDFLYGANPLGITVWRFDDERAAIEESGFTPLMGTTAATINRAGDFVYAAADGALVTFERNPTTGALELTDRLTTGWNASAHAGTDSVAGTRIEAIDGLVDARMIALDATGDYLFSFGDRGVKTAAFSLADPAEPRFLVAAEPFSRGFYVANHGWLSNPALCRYAGVRSQTLSVDVVCIDSIFSAKLLPDMLALRPEDDLVSASEDRFGNPLPPFRSATGDVAASPDGRHLYMTTADAIYIFERVGSL